MTMITPSYLGETIEYSSLHACRSTLEDPTHRCDRWQQNLQQVFPHARLGLRRQERCPEWCPENDERGHIR